MKAIILNILFYFCDLYKNRKFRKYIYKQMLKKLIQKKAFFDRELKEPNIGYCHVWNEITLGPPDNVTVLDRFRKYLPELLNVSMTHPDFNGYNKEVTEGYDSHVIMFFYSNKIDLRIEILTQVIKNMK